MGQQAGVSAARSDGSSDDPSGHAATDGRLPSAAPTSRKVRMDIDITRHVDGKSRSLPVDTRTTVLDALREQLGVTAPKKGCDHGQCGSCVPRRRPPRHDVPEPRGRR
jgi:hypothetical protein